MSEQVDYNRIAEAVETATRGKGIKGFAKRLTYTIIIIAFLVGVIGSFEFVPLDMDAYAKFLPAVSLFVIPLILSIGANSAVEKIRERDVERAKVAASATVKKE